MTGLGIGSVQGYQAGTAILDAVKVGGEIRLRVKGRNLYQPIATFDGCPTGFIHPNQRSASKCS
jgi:hypothetical protein